MKAYSTMGHIHAINQVIEKSEKYNKPLYLAFIDCEKTFDSAGFAAVMRTLRDQGVDKAHLGLLEDIYKDFTGTIILHKHSKTSSYLEGPQASRLNLPKLTACLGSWIRTCEVYELL